MATTPQRSFGTVLRLQVDGATREALEELARLTGREGRTRFARLVQDALRIYEWVVTQQARGRTIIALEPAEVELLRETRAVAGTREALAPVIVPGAQEEAARYLKRAAS